MTLFGLPTTFLHTSAGDIRGAHPFHRHRQSNTAGLVDVRFFDECGLLHAIRYVDTAAEGSHLRHILHGYFHSQSSLVVGFSIMVGFIIETFGKMKRKRATLRQPNVTSSTTTQAKAYSDFFTQFRSRLPKVGIGGNLSACSGDSMFITWSCMSCNTLFSEYVLTNTSRTLLNIV